MADAGVRVGAARVAQVVRDAVVVAVAAHRQSRLRIELEVEPPHLRILSARPAQRGVELRIGRVVVDVRLRLALELVVEEIVDAIADDRATKGGAQLLILIRQHLAGDGILRVELRIAEVASESTAQRIGARFGDGVHLDAA
jgi:hypothetical protein